MLCVVGLSHFQDAQQIPEILATNCFTLNHQSSHYINILHSDKVSWIIKSPICFDPKFHRIFVFGANCMDLVDDMTKS